MKGILALLGVLAVGSAQAQTENIIWQNNQTTPIFTNDCSGTIGRIAGVEGYKLGFYVGPFGTPEAGLALFALGTNYSSAPGLFRTAQPHVPLMPGIKYSCQVRGWSFWAGSSYEEALQNPAASVYAGASILGYFTTPILGGIPIPIQIFGTGPGQIGGFELQKGSCRALAHNQMAPFGPVAITSSDRDGVVKWTNMVANNAVYHFAYSGAVAGPYANYTPVTSVAASVTFTNPYPGPGFAKVRWVDAGPAQPIGDWDYQAFEGTAAVIVAGILSFTSNVPTTVARNFSRIALDGQSAGATLHPRGAGTMDAAMGLSGTNSINLSYGDFTIRGQMAGNYFAGNWEAIDYVIWIPGDPPPPVSFIIRSGRFIALRRR